jgi:mycofactocin precursor
MNTQTENAILTVAPQPVMADQQPTSPQIIRSTRGDAQIHPDKPQIQEELVIEEISIDGMCGVY